jgi:hypothetical protein
MSTKNTQKEILIIAATHGNERIGIEVIQALQENGYDRYFDTLTGNPKALKNNVRFIEADLNRSYPGNPQSLFYEERIASQNLKKARSYRYVIDLHEASSGTDDFIIVPRKSLDTIFPVELIDLPTILLWPDPAGPLGQVLENCIELEFGVKGRDRKQVANGAVDILQKFFVSLYTQELTSDALPVKEVYDVYGKLLQKETSLSVNDLRDFRKARNGEEVFYPLLTGQYLSDGILCYKMKRA